MCVFHGEGETCDFCEAPLQLEVVGVGEDSGVAAVLNPSLSAPSLSHISGLLSGRYWNTSDLKFGFTTSASQYLSSEAPNGERSSHKEFSEGGKEIYRDAMSQWEDVSGLNLTEASSPATAELRIAGSNAPTTAWAYYPSNGWGGGGDIWANTNYISAYKASVGDASGAVGTYAYATALHEIGHALGLEHPHDGTKMSSSYDSTEYSVMSYKSYVGHTSNGYTNETHGYAQSLMMLDIAAIQSVYGADYTTRSGDTTYSFNASTGEMKIDGVTYATPAQNRIYRTLWDGNGFDTLDFAGYTTDISVNLNPGEATDLDVGGLNQRSRLGYKSGEWVYSSAHVYMSLLYQDDVRSLIEAVVTGSGDDILLGNEADNLLSGGLGFDTYTLGDGADTVSGTLAELVGDKIIDFGSEDVVVATDIGSGKAIEVGSDGVIGVVDAPETDDPEEPEEPETPAEPDDPEEPETPDEPDDPETPEDPETEDGACVIRLTDGRDSFTSETDEDLVVLAFSQNDSVETGAGADRLVGGSGRDNLESGSGADTLQGGSGRDRLDAGVGNDVLKGGTDSDYLRGRDGHDILFGGSDGDNLRGDNGRDSLSGGNGKDRLDGGHGLDLLYGDDGDDKISGKNGEDTLYGGKGDDTLNGGNEADIFVFHKNDSGNDVIEKLVFGEDKIEINGFSGGFDDLTLTDKKKGTLITIDSGVTVLVKRTSVEDFSESDFEFYSGNNTAPELENVSLDDVSDPGAGSLELSGGADELKLSVKTDLEIDLLGGADNVTAGRGDDTIEGGGGKDKIKGSSGDDRIAGGRGDDTMYGGSGDDVFVFRASEIASGDTDFDTIRDFRYKNDRILLEGFECNDLDDLELTFHQGKAAIVVDEVQTIWLKNLRDYDDFLEQDLIDFI